jgi:hypothetical protein
LLCATVLYQFVHHWLSPFKHAHLNVMGRYSFPASAPVGGGLWPLRDLVDADAAEVG